MASDSEIINGLKQGNKQIFETLFKAFYAPLTRYAQTIVKDFDAAEEIVQEFFCRIWWNRVNISVGSSLKGYLFKSVHNRCLHYLEHQKVEERYSANYMSVASEAQEPTEERIYYSELETAVGKVLSKLPVRSAKVFKMNRFEGKKYREIADELSISVKTVEADMGLALKEFRMALGTY